MDFDWTSQSQWPKEMMRGFKKALIRYNSTITSSPAPFYAGFEDARRIVGIWELVLFFLGTPMNVLVIYMAVRILRKMDQQENQHLCILNMALADLLFTSMQCPLMFLNFALNVDFQSPVCKFKYYVTHTSTVASSLSLLCLNLDKFVSLRFPLRYHSILTYCRTKIFLFLSWIIAFSWATFFVFGPLTFEDHCQVYPAEPFAYTVFFILFFFLPISISLAISIYIMTVAIEARKSLSNRSSESDRSAPGRRSNFSIIYQGKRGSTATILVRNRRHVWNLKRVTFVFITTVWSSLTFIPYRILYLVHFFHPEAWIGRLGFGLLAVMTSNSTGNPIITLLTQHQYRHLMKKVILKRARLISGGTDTAAPRSSAHSMISLNSFDDGKRRQDQLTPPRTPERTELLP